jgi:outer membrane protein OmpA-like peptidoglycan-associated protein
MPMISNIRAVLPMVAIGLLAVAAHAQSPDATPQSPAVPAQTPGAPAPGAPPAAAPPTPVPFDAAVLKAANDLFTKANLTGEPDKIVLVVDPLIDGNSGVQSNATVTMGQKIVDLVKANYPRFQVAPFTSAMVAKSPVVLIGTFTAINNAGIVQGAPDVYRVCLALVDLGSQKIISKGVARALPDGVDVTPTSFFADSPVFAKDASIDSYIKTCQGTKPGDAIVQAYADRILVASLIDDAIESYNAKHYSDALDVYRSALRTPGGEQLRVLNGIYLTDYALHRRKDASDAFGNIVDFGLKGDRLAIKFLFKPGSTQFVTDPRLRAPYQMWLGQIAQHTAATKACLEIDGHTSATGIPAINNRLSALRAEYIMDEVQDHAPALSGHLIAAGKGSSEMIIGTGKDDASDALDRRVEFKVINCGATPALPSTKS